MADTLDSLRIETVLWANQQFGTKERQIGKIKHLQKEVNELLSRPFDVEEMADCFLLLMHIADGFDLVGVARYKLDVNKMRRWEQGNNTEAIEHQR